MLRPAVIASFSTVAAVVLFVAPAAAAEPPSPPPGSLNVQPVGVTTTGQPGAYHCGAAASASGNGYSIQPQQISSSGAASPTGCGTNALSGGGGTQASSSGENTSSGRAAQTQQATDQTKVGGVAPAASPHGAGGFFGGPLWMGLLLLLALFLLLIGFALGRRRPARAIAY